MIQLRGRHRSTCWLLATVNQTLLWLDSRSWSSKVYARWLLWERAFDYNLVLIWTNRDQDSPPLTPHSCPLLSTVNPVENDSFAETRIIRQICSGSHMLNWLASFICLQLSVPIKAERQNGSSRMPRHCRESSRALQTLVLFTWFLNTLTAPLIELIRPAEARLLSWQPYWQSTGNPTAAFRLK